MRPGTITGIADAHGNNTFVYNNANRRTTLTLPNGVTVVYTKTCPERSRRDDSRVIEIAYTAGGTQLGNLSYGGACRDDECEMAKSTTVQAALDSLRYVAITTFTVTWAVPMYLSFYGPSRPSPVTGAIYPITIHGGVTYGTYWQQCISSSSATIISIALVALNVLLRKLYLPDRPF